MPLATPKERSIYVRQSTFTQTQENTESLALPMSAPVRDRTGLGRGQITVVDDDLARSAAGAAGGSVYQPGRRGQPGQAASSSAGRCSRLARNNTLFRYRNNVFCSAYGFMPRRAAPPWPGR